jgi:predicted RNase H-like HicB family nuclease
MLKPFKVIVEKHPDGYVAYPVGLKGVVVAQGDSYEAALGEIKSAIEFHIETFGREVIEGEDLAQDVYLTEAEVSLD